MAVLESVLGGFTPLCNECGISICWDISPEEYEAAKAFWDDYCCKTCNPDYKGALQRFMQSQVKKD
jgi:hypothetical protein